MTQEAWKIAGDWALYSVFAVSLLFVFLYLFLSPWWKKEAGRNIMAVMGALAVAVGYFSFAVFRKGIPPGFYPTRFFLFVMIALSIGWRVVIFIRRQILVRNNIRKERRNEEVS